MAVLSSEIVLSRISDSSLIFSPSSAISVRLSPLYLALKSRFFMREEISVSSLMGSVSLVASSSAIRAPRSDMAMPMYPMKRLAIAELL